MYITVNLLYYTDNQAAVQVRTENDLPAYDLPAAGCCCSQMTCVLTAKLWQEAFCRNSATADKCDFLSMNAIPVFSAVAWNSNTGQPGRCLECHSFLSGDCPRR